MTAAMATLANIRRAMKLDANTQYIGSQVFWELSDAEMKYDDLKALLDANGVDSRETKDGGLMPSRVTPCSAWKRAIAEFKKSDYVKNNNLLVDSEDIAAVKGGAGPRGLLTIHIKSVDAGASEVGFTQQWALEFDKQAAQNSHPSSVITRKYTAPQGQQDGLYDSIVSHYWQAIQSVNMNDVRETIKRVLTSARAFSMRKQGGIYFVPQEFSNTVRTLEGIVSKIGSSKLYVLELPKVSERTVETFKQTLADALETELESLTSKLEASIDSIRKTQKGEVSNTYSVIIEEMQDFNARADYYSEVLQAKHAQLMEKWGVLQKKVEERVASLT